MPETDVLLAPERAAVAFGRVLREADLDVPVDSVLAFVRAWEAVASMTAGSCTGPAGRPWSAVPRTSASTTRPSPPSSAASSSSPRARRPPPPVPVPAAGDDGEDEGDEDGPDGPAAHVVRWSPGEVLRHKDFAACTDDERAEAMRLHRRPPHPSAPGGPPAAAARRPGPGAGPTCAAPPAAALRTGGETVDRRVAGPRRADRVA